VYGSSGVHFVELLRVQGKTEGGLETGAERLGVACSILSIYRKEKGEIDAPRARTPELLILALTNAAESR
jgi:hypothetical protein